MRGYRNYVVIGLFVLGMAFLYGRIDHSVPPYSSWDLASYLKMAEAAPGLSDVIQPFAYRLTGPYIAGLLPFSEPISFYLLSIFFTITLAFLFHRFLIERGIKAGHSMFIVMLLLMNKHFIGFNLWNSFQLNDIIALNIMLLLFMSIFAQRWLLFGIYLAIGAFTRETTLIMLPVAFLYLFDRRGKREDWLRLSLSALPALLIFAGLRLLIDTTGGEALLPALMHHSKKLLSPMALFRLLINPFLPLTLIPFISYRKSISFMIDRKYLLVFVVLVLFSSLFGSNNERLVAPLFIVFYWLLAELLADMNFPTKIVIFAFTFIASFHHMIGWWPLPDRRMTMLLTFGSTIIITGWVFVERILSVRGRRTLP